MKKAIVLSLALLILSISMKDLAIYALFKANQDYLTENSCLNRFSPEELCFATCVLTATMQDNQEQNQHPGTLLDQSKKVIYLFDDFSERIAITEVEQYLMPTRAVLLFPQPLLSSIFQPPEC